MRFSAIFLFAASVAAVALDTSVSPELSRPGRRGVDCGACAGLVEESNLSNMFDFNLGISGQMYKA
ncbi:hypothetical protein LX32DRAFT_728895 [Colletotrichum zoysiae]|uniref:Uncharacterized protein n=1 Tax=Colletotrichum zoysiae TaxID=1216348 RepID=A0AAD9HHU5_9PEZI|nr:hypothetical protein LX32DRAFT_728895 [Colletotrichum zoysiae]